MEAGYVVASLHCSSAARAWHTIDGSRRREESRESAFAAPPCPAQGIIIHGCVRDTREIGQLTLGVKAIAPCPLKSSKRDPGLRDVPVSFGGVTVRPGDWWVGAAHLLRVGGLGAAGKTCWLTWPCSYSRAMPGRAHARLLPIAAQLAYVALRASPTAGSMLTKMACWCRPPI